MSSILKALRKLEEEKAALGEGGVDIARDILKRSAHKQERNIFWPLVSVSLLLLLAGGTAYFWLGYPQPAANLHKIKIAPAKSLIEKSSTQDGSVVASAVVRPKEAQALAAPGSVPLAQIPQQERTTPPSVHVEPQAIHPNGSPFLKLTGIAYRDKSTERIAIINDLPVMQGTSIEGAQIVEILPDRVVLSSKGVEFTLKLESDH